eukprot:12909587-Prorocentrum_lima.AAC.1
MAFTRECNTQVLEQHAAEECHLQHLQGQPKYDGKEAYSQPAGAEEARGLGGIRACTSGGAGLAAAGARRVARLCGR